MDNDDQMGYFMNDASSFSIISPMSSKKTKIVATIGPATESEEKIAELITAGMNVARFNTKHNEPSWHREVALRVRKVAKEMKTPVAILLDLQGPEIRINLKKDQIALKKHDRLTFVSEETQGSDENVFIPLHVIQSLNVGNRLVMDDGACRFLITEKTEHHLVVECLDDCIIKTRKTLNTPNIVIDMPALLPKDELYLDELCEEKIEYVALSFVRTTEDITHLRSVLKQKGITSDIIAKIENRKAVENLDSIVRESDAVMVARGDLAIEVDFEELIYWQKKIVRLSQKYAKPVIVATQMLASMVEKPVPTRAEISDIANAVYDGTDAVMLSEETTVGKYPVRAVEIQAKIAEHYEQYTSECFPESGEETKINPLLHSTLNVLKQKEKSVEKIVIVCDDPNMVRQLSSYRCKTSLLAVTSSLELSQKLALSYGVEPIFIPDIDLHTINSKDLFDILKTNEKLSLGERVLFLYTFTQTEENTSDQPSLREVI
jgi:pyruvate kinase